MSDDDPNEWGPGEIAERVYLLREGKAYKDDARKLLELFCSLAGQRQPSDSLISDKLFDFVVSAFRDYLNGDAPSLDHAFGLKQRGRPRSREALEKRELIACAVAARMLLEKEDLYNAAMAVGGQFSVHESDVQNFYAEHKSLAIGAAEIQRLLTKIQRLLTSRNA